MMRWSPAAPRRPNCPHRRLHHLLARALPQGMPIDTSTLRPWASANFVGARHIYLCDGHAMEAGPMAILESGALQAQLAAIHWSLAGHIVADVTIEPADMAGRYRIEILTVED